MKKYGYLVEIVVALLALEAVNQLRGGEPFGHLPYGLIGINPHPYWLIVVLIAVRYGVRAGLIGSTICAVAFTVCNWLASGLSAEVYRSPNNVLDNIWQPVLFIIFGALLGEMRSRQDHRLLAAYRRAEEAEGRAEALNRNFEAVQTSKEELQKRIVGQVETVSTLYDAAKKLESLDAEEIYPAILDMLTRYLRVTSCAVYLLDGSRLVRKVHCTAAGSAPPGGEYDLNGSVMGRAIRRGAVVAVPELVSKANFESYGGDSLMAAPIFDLDRSAIGAVSVAAMGFYDFNPSNRKLFEMIADWANRAIGNAMYYKRAMDKNIRDDELGFFNYNYFQQRIEEEFADSKRHDIPLSLMFIRFEVAKGLGRDRYIRFLTSVGAALQGSLRKVDIVTKYRVEQTLAAIVRTKRAADVSTLADRLAAEIGVLAAKISPRPGDVEVKIGFASVEKGMEEPSELILRAERAAGLPPADGGKV